MGEQIHRSADEDDAKVRVGSNLQVLLVVSVEGTSMEGQSIYTGAWRSVRPEKVEPVFCGRGDRGEVIVPTGLINLEGMKLHAGIEATSSTLDVA